MGGSHCRWAISYGIHPNLYWALSGGGGTYGVVVSMTVKVHQQEVAVVVGMSFAVLSTSTGTEDFWAAVKMFIESLPSMVDSGLHVSWTLASGIFAVTPTSGPGISQQEIDKLFAPTISQLNQTSIPYQYNSQSCPTWLRGFEAFILPSANVSSHIIYSRLIPRSVIDVQADDFISVLQTTVQKNFIAVGNSINVSAQNSSNVAVNPYWRQTTVHLSIGTFFNYQDFASNFQNLDLMTNTLIPLLRELTPNGAVYINEADFQQPDWKWVFYGPNYGQFNEVKSQYDPLDVFYALRAVGSDRWEQRKDGRLCRL